MKEFIIVGALLCIWVILIVWSSKLIMRARDRENEVFKDIIRKHGGLPK